MSLRIVVLMARFSLVSEFKPRRTSRRLDQFYPTENNGHRRILVSEEDFSPSFLFK
jgi:hypothetical protein